MKGNLRQHVLMDVVLLLLVIVQWSCQRNQDLSFSCRTESGKAIVGASVSLDDTPQGETDSQGKLLVKIPLPKTGIVKLRVEHSEYTPYEKQIPIQRVEQIKYAIMLHPKRYVNITCKEEIPDQSGAYKPLAEVTIVLNDEKIGISDADGKFKYEHQIELGDSLRILAYRENYVLLTPAPLIIPVLLGQNEIQRELLFTQVPQIKPMQVTVRAITYPDQQPIDDIQITLHDQSLGTTDASGLATIPLKEPIGAPVILSFKRDGYSLNPNQFECIMREEAICIVKINGSVGETQPPLPIPDSQQHYALAYRTNVHVSNEAKIPIETWNQVVGNIIHNTNQNTTYLSMVKTTEPLSPLSGWNKEAVGIDFLIELNIFSEDKNKIELVLYDPHGQPVYRSVTSEVTAENPGEYITSIIERMRENFPVDGYVAAIDDTGFWINSGFDKDIRVNDTFMDSNRKTQAVIDQVEAARAHAILKKGNAELGQHLARIRLPLETTAMTSLLLSFIDPDTKEPLSGVLVYRDQSYVGSTDAAGNLGFLAPVNRNYIVEATKIGYKSFSKTYQHFMELSEQIQLPLMYCRLRVVSVPENSSVLLDETVVGKTPLDQRIKVGFYKLRLIPSDGERYSVYEYPDRVPLLKAEFELKVTHEGNYLDKARDLQQKGSFTEALELYALMPEPTDPNHADNYITARFEMGRIYLDKLKQYDQAIVCFKKVIEYDDKYAIAHANLALALYQFNKPESAIVEFDRALGFKNFIPKERYESVLSEILFYRAMAHERLIQTAEESLKDSMRERACEQWIRYIDFYEGLKPEARITLVKTYEMVQGYKRKSCK